VSRADYRRFGDTVSRQPLQQLSGLLANGLSCQFRITPPHICGSMYAGVQSPDPVRCLHVGGERPIPQGRLIRAALPTRKTFFDDLRALTRYVLLPNWDGLLEFMMRGLEIGPYAPSG